jgi:hypothetical protein
MRTNPEQQFPRSLLIVASLALALPARSAPPEPQVIFPPSLPGGRQ